MYQLLLPAAYALSLAARACQLLRAVPETGHSLGNAANLVIARVAELHAGIARGQRLQRSNSLIQWLKTSAQIPRQTQQTDGNQKQRDTGCKSCQKAADQHLSGIIFEGNERSDLMPCQIAYLMGGDGVNFGPDGGFKILLLPWRDQRCHGLPKLITGSG